MSSGPYQSRLLNFAVQQTRRLRDRSMQTWRQLRLSTLWGVQIALYPIYAVFQATRLTGRQLWQVVRQTIPQLRLARHTLQNATRSTQTPVAIAVDTPIKNTLVAVQALSLSVAPTAIEGAILPTSSPSLTQPIPNLLRQALKLLPFWQAPPEYSPSSALTPSPKATLTTREPALLPTEPLALSLRATLAQQEAVQADPIRGIATLLTTHKLVLVTEQNRLLDILTPEQDDYLRRRIVGEMAGYLRQWRLFAIPQSVSSVLPPPASRPYALPPVRSLYEVMRWMQRSPVAIAVNLFNETAWLELERRSPSLTVQSDPINNPWDAKLQPEQNFLTPWLNRSPRVTAPLPTSLPSDQTPPLLSGTRRIVLAGSGAIAPTEADAESPLTPGSISGQPLTQTPQTALEPIQQLAEAQIQPASAESLNTSIQRDVIDIQASLVEYVKHPLQQLLEWIDLGMLWVEKRVVQFVTWFRRNF